MKLPYHRRYNFKIMSRNLRLPRKAVLLIMATLLGYLVYQGEELLRSKNAEMKAEQAYLGLKLEVLQIASFGAPKSISEDDFAPDIKN